MLHSFLFAFIAIILYAYSVLRYYDVWKRIKIPFFIYVLIHILSLLISAVLLMPWIGTIPYVFLWTGNAYITLYSAVMLVTPILCFFRGIIRFLGKRFRWRGKVYRFVNHPMKLILCFLVLSIGVGTYGLVHERCLQKFEYKMKTDKEMLTDQMTVFFLTDLKIGNRMSQAELSELVEKMNAEKPDLVLLGGNIIGQGVSEQTALKILDQLQKLVTEQGVYMVGGSEDSKRLAQLAKEIERRGLRYLCDEGVVLANGVQLVGCGVPDREKRKRLPYTLSLTDPKKPTILLTYEMEEDKIFREEKIDVVLRHGFAGQYGWKKEGTTNFLQTSGVRTNGFFRKYIVPSEYIKVTLTTSAYRRQ